MHKIVFLTAVEKQALDVRLAAFSIAMALDIPMLVHKMRMPRGRKWRRFEKLSAFKYKELSAMSGESCLL